MGIQTYLIYIYEIMKSHCAACNAPLDNDSWHYLACAKRRKNELNMRHLALELHYSQHVGIVTRIEASRFTLRGTSAAAPLGGLHPCHILGGVPEERSSPSM